MRSPKVGWRAFSLFRKKIDPEFFRLYFFCLKSAKRREIQNDAPLATNRAVIRENCVLTSVIVVPGPSNIILPRSFVARENEISRARGLQFPQLIYNYSTSLCCPLTPEQVGEGVLEDGPEEHDDGGEVPREADGGDAGEDDPLEEVVDQDLVARLLGGGGDKARVHGQRVVFTHDSR